MASIASHDTASYTEAVLAQEAASAAAANAAAANAAAQAVNTVDGDEAAASAAAANAAAASAAAEAARDNAIEYAGMVQTAYDTSVSNENKALADARDAAKAAADAAAAAKDAADTAVAGLADMASADEASYAKAMAAQAAAKAASDAAAAANQAAMLAGTSAEAKTQQAIAETEQGKAVAAQADAEMYAGMVRQAKQKQDDQDTADQLAKDIADALGKATDANMAAKEAAGKAKDARDALRDTPGATPAEIAAASDEMAAAEKASDDAAAAHQKALAASLQGDLAGVQAAQADAEQAQLDAETALGAITTAQMAIDKRNDDAAAEAKALTDAKSAAMTAMGAAETAAADAEAKATDAEAAATMAEEAAPGSSGAMAARTAATAARAAATAARAAATAAATANTAAQAAETSEVAKTHQATAEQEQANAEGEQTKAIAKRDEAIAKRNEVISVDDQILANAKKTALAGPIAAAKAAAADAKSAADTALSSAQAALSKAQNDRTDVENAQKAVDAAKKAVSDAAAAVSAVAAAETAVNDATTTVMVETAKNAANDAKAAAETAKQAAMDASEDATAAAGTQVLDLLKMANAVEVEDVKGTDDNETQQHADEAAAAVAAAVKDTSNTNGGGAVSNISWAADTPDNPDTTANEFVAGAFAFTITPQDGSAIAADFEGDDANTKKIGGLPGFDQAYELSTRNATTGIGTSAWFFSDIEQTVAAASAVTLKEDVHFSNKPAVASRIVLASGATTLTGATYDHDGDPDTNGLTATLTCGSAQATNCSYDIKDGKLTSLVGYVVSVSVAASTNFELVAAKEAVTDTDFSSFGVWMSKAADGGDDDTLPDYTAGAFASGAADYDLVQALTGTASYSGPAAGVKSMGGSTSYVQGTATLNADFGVEADSTADPPVENIWGKVSGNVNIGGMNIVLGEDVLTSQGDGDALGGNTRAGGTVDNADGTATYMYTGKWDGSFHGPSTVGGTGSDANDPVMPTSVVGTFGVSGGKGDNMMSILGAFGAKKNK